MDLTEGGCSRGSTQWRHDCYNKGKKREDGDVLGAVLLAPSYRRSGRANRRPFTFGAMMAVDVNTGGSRVGGPELCV